MLVKSLETNRLIIRRTKKEDTDFCLDIWLDDEMGKYLSDPPREKANDTYLKWKENVEVYDGCYYFIAVSKKTGNYIGTCSTIPSEDKKHWDLGYAIPDKILCAYIPLLEVLPEYRGQGIGYELVQLMLNTLKEYYMVDLICDNSLTDFYKDFNMFESKGMIIRNFKMQSGK